MAAEKEHSVLTTGRLYNTFEWVPQLFTEFGTGPTDDFRIDGTPVFAHGAVAVLIHGNPLSRPRAVALQAFARRLLEKDIGRLLIFGNTDERVYFGSFFGGFRGTGVACIPHLLGDLAYSLLNATKVYIEFRNAVSWKWKTNISNTRRES